MSYWNYSSNAIYSENKETIKEIHEKMKNAIKENACRLKKRLYLCNPINKATSYNR